MKVAKVVISIILLLSVLVTTAYAADPEGVVLSVKGFQTQEKTNWCWVACARNSVRFERSVLRSQTAAVKKVKGANVNEGGTIAEIEKAAEYISYSNEDYDAISKKLSFVNLKSQVKRNNITIACAGYYDSNNVRNGGHAVVIIGYVVNSNGNYVQYFDPWDGIPYICSYTQFCNGSYNNRKYDFTVYNNE